MRISRHEQFRMKATLPRLLRLLRFFILIFLAIYRTSVSALLFFAFTPHAQSLTD